MSMRRVYRRIWGFYLSGTVLFFAVAAFGGRRVGGTSRDTRTPAAWLLVLPAALFLLGALTSMRSWRCESCGHVLPTMNARKCARCGGPIDYS